MSAEGLNLLLQITGAFGTIIIGILSFVAVMSWRISSGLKERDDKLNSCIERVSKHEESCETFRSQILARLDEGSTRFGKIISDLSYMRGRLDEERERGNR